MVREVVALLAGIEVADLVVEVKMEVEVTVVVAVVIELDETDGLADDTTVWATEESWPDGEEISASSISSLIEGMIGVISALFSLIWSTSLNT